VDIRKHDIWTGSRVELTPSIVVYRPEADKLLDWIVGPGWITPMLDLQSADNSYLGNVPGRRGFGSGRKAVPESMCVCCLSREYIGSTCSVPWL
jgi:hypothetical protein